MDNLVLFCKSFRDDVLRAKKLAHSISQFNSDALPFYVSVPVDDLALFRQELNGMDVRLISDQDVVCKIEGGLAGSFDELPGGLAQQVVKSEFWRLGIAENYVCLDSDCYFLRPFFTSDFLSPDGTPYTVMHESKELLHFADIAGLKKIGPDRERDCKAMMSLFGRDGRLWDFGPIPVVWSARVWRDLDEKYLQPRGMNFIDAIQGHPAELRWYGEALLAYRSIPLLPVEPLFRCYHYEEQYHFWRRAGETDKLLARHYLGLCVQSNWDKRLDLVKRFRFGKLRKRVRRFFRGY
jgi:hypothetical protein